MRYVKRPDRDLVVLGDERLYAARGEALARHRFAPLQQARQTRLKTRL